MQRGGWRPQRRLWIDIATYPRGPTGRQSIATPVRAWTRRIQNGAPKVRHWCNPFKNRSAELVGTAAPSALDSVALLFHALTGVAIN